MPDTGEDRELKQRVNAKEAERVSQSKKLFQKSKNDKAIGQQRANYEKGTKRRRQ